GGAAPEAQEEHEEADHPDLHAQSMGHSLVRAQQAARGRCCQSLQATTTLPKGPAARRAKASPRRERGKVESMTGRMPPVAWAGATASRSAREMPVEERNATALRMARTTSSGAVVSSRKPRSATVPPRQVAAIERLSPAPPATSMVTSAPRPRV